MNDLIIASSNKHKIDEIKSILKEYINLKSLKDFPKIKEPIEDGTTYANNALIKAKYYSKILGGAVLAEDSGFEITSLNNNPGVLSARYAKELGGYNNTFSEILKRLTNKDDRSARFISCLCFYKTNGEYSFFNGFLEGFVSYEIIGTNGFGYDAIFIPKGYSETFAQMSDLEKNNISHRKIALKKFIEQCLI